MSLRISITDGDIKAAEKLMGEEIRFRDEQIIKILKCTETKDIQACPGSGKTTILVGKLAILARKWPFNHRGICVLSHTNAARIEIENRLRGIEGHILLTYPHFVGTIQHFVDQYLGITAAIKRFNVRPSFVDDERYILTFRRSLENNKSYMILRNFLNFRHRGERREANLDSAIQDFQYEGPALELDFPAGKGTPSYDKFHSLKNAISCSGCFGFQDMFALAEWYISEYPRIAKLIRLRFPFVFIDEMQDTNASQVSILNKIFKPSEQADNDELEPVIQRFGDINQAIFERISGNEEENNFPIDGFLKMDYSFRYSNSIAKLLENLCLERQELKGNNDIPDFDHTIFLFSEESSNKVEIPTLIGHRFRL